MGLIEEELEKIAKFCQSQKIPDLRLITCTRAHVRVEFSKSKVKTIASIFQFPLDYPDEPVLIELKSKTIGEILLNRLTLACEEFAKNGLGNPQIINCIGFLNKFLDDNPLCCCADEIAAIKKNVINSSKDEFKLKQKSSSIIANLNEGPYNHKMMIKIPQDYPEVRLTVETLDSNFPNYLQRVLQGQSVEIARRCVEPPLNKRKLKSNAGPFVPQPSLLPVLSFVVPIIHRLPNEKCTVCKIDCLPQNPVDVVNDEQHDLHIERVYCGHFYHLKCLVEYMKTPPFTGGKKCLECGERIYHDKYKVSAELSESRWAHQQARQRELDEVAEFLS